MASSFSPRARRARQPCSRVPERARRRASLDLYAAAGSSLRRPDRRRVVRDLPEPERSLTTHVDVLVVGAGPAGLAVARTTAAAGLTTLVIERQKEIGEHVRTSGMTATSTVRYVGAPAETFHSLETLRVVAPGASVAFPATAETGFCVLDVRG